MRGCVEEAGRRGAGGQESKVCCDDCNELCDRMMPQMRGSQHTADVQHQSHMRLVHAYSAALAVGVSAGAAGGSGPGDGGGGGDGTVLSAMELHRSEVQLREAMRGVPAQHTFQPCFIEAMVSCIVSSQHQYSGVIL